MYATILDRIFGVGDRQTCVVRGATDEYGGATLCPASHKFYQGPESVRIDPPERFIQQNYCWVGQQCSSDHEALDAGPWTFARLSSGQPM